MKLKLKGKGLLNEIKIEKMETNNLVPIDGFCSNCDVEFSFINSLNDCGLIDIITLDDKKYILNRQLKKIEEAMHFHYELNVNIEGIAIIHNLLNQISDLKEEMSVTQNKLDFFYYR